MEITEVKVYPVRETGGLKGYATFVIDNCGRIRDGKVIEGERGFFVSMPSRRKQDGSFRDIVHPLNAETRSLIEQMVIEQFNKVREAQSSEAATL